MISLGHIQHFFLPYWSSSWAAEHSDAQHSLFPDDFHSMTIQANKKRGNEQINSIWKAHLATRKRLLGSESPPRAQALRQLTIRIVGSRKQASAKSIQFKNIWNYNRESLLGDSVNSFIWSEKPLSALRQLTIRIVGSRKQASANSIQFGIITEKVS